MAYPWSRIKNCSKEGSAECIHEGKKSDLKLLIFMKGSMVVWKRFLKDRLHTHTRYHIHTCICVYVCIYISFVYAYICPGHFWMEVKKQKQSRSGREPFYFILCQLNFNCSHVSLAYRKVVWQRLHESWWCCFAVCAWPLGPGVDPLPRAVFWLRRSEDDPRQQASTSSPACSPNRQNLSSHQVGIALRLSGPGLGKWKGMQPAMLVLSRLWVSGVQWRGPGSVTSDTQVLAELRKSCPHLCVVKDRSPSELVLLHCSRHHISLSFLS